MFCIQCGSRNEDHALHCIQCGAALPQAGGIPQQAFAAPSVAPTAAAAVPNYMAQSVLITLFCCTPIGIAAIIKSREVDKKLAINDRAGAIAASNSAKTMLWVGCALGLVVWIGIIIASAS